MLLPLEHKRKSHFIPAGLNDNALEFYVGPLRSLKVLTASEKKQTSYIILSVQISRTCSLYFQSKVLRSPYLHIKTLKVLKVVALTPEALKVTRESLYLSLIPHNVRLYTSEMFLNSLFDKF